MELEKSSVKNYLSKMTTNQAILLKNSNVLNKDIRKLHNTGEKILTESGIYKLIFKSDKKEVSSFANFTQRKYDYDKLEKQLLGWVDDEEDYE